MQIGLHAVHPVQFPDIGIPLIFPLHYRISCPGIDLIAVTDRLQLGKPPLSQRCIIQITGIYLFFSFRYPALELRSIFFGIHPGKIFKGSNFRFQCSDHLSADHIVFQDPVKVHHKIFHDPDIKKNDNRKKQQYSSRIYQNLIFNG